nr:SJCHGC02547 protein [Schistosoma japonicum]
MLQNEDLKRCAESLKESFEKAQSSCKQNKREIAGLEEENARINAKCRRLQRDLEEVMEAKRIIERDLQNLRKLSRCTTRSNRQLPSMLSTRSSDGTPDENNSINELDSMASDFGNSGSVSQNTTTNNNNHASTMSSATEN